MTLELDKIKDTPVSNDDKCSWLVKSLMTHEVMYRACTDTSNFEHTYSGLQDTELNKIPFDQFYSMLKNDARLKDSKNDTMHRMQQTPHQVNQAQQQRQNQHRNNQHPNNNNTNNTYNPHAWLPLTET